MSDTDDILKEVLTDDEQFYYDEAKTSGDTIIGMLCLTIERLARESKRAKAIVDRLPKCWRHDGEQWVRDVPVIPGVGEKRYIVSNGNDSRFLAGPCEDPGVYEVEPVRFDLDSNREHGIWGFLLEDEETDLNFWDGDLIATREDAERAMAGQQEQAEP